MPIRPCGYEVVELFEREHNIALPKDYRNFLAIGPGEAVMENQGAIFLNTHGPCSGGFGYFCYLDPAPTNDLFALTGPAMDNNAPRNSLRVGVDQAACGSFVLSLEQVDFGAVYWTNLDFGWELDESEEYGVRNADLMLADSFSAFLDVIRRSVIEETTNQRLFLEAIERRETHVLRPEVIQEFHQKGGKFRKLFRR